MMTSPGPLVLPDFIYSKAQVHALVAEILRIEDFLRSTRTRQPGTKMSLPKTTTNLDRFAEANKRNVLNHSHRTELAQFLRTVYKHSPVLVMGVGIDYNSKFIEGIVNWFRLNVDEKILFQVRPQAKLGLGCIIRVRHKTYDFSLKKRFDDVDEVLRSALAGSSVSAPQQLTGARAKYF